MNVGVRSGGHGYSANHLRDGGLLLDLAALDGVSVEPDLMRVSVGPARTGEILAGDLASHGLFFPVGHCAGVALGGYLLSGGYGWNGRVCGPACMSIEAVDVVTADGELVHADRDRNEDLLWAVRGGGPEFFGVITRFHLRTRTLPSAIANRSFLFPADAFDAVFRWVHALGAEVPSSVELAVLVRRNERGILEIAVSATAFGDDLGTVAADLGLLDQGAVVEQALLVRPIAPVTLADLFEATGSSYPTGWRYSTDNMWTHADIDELLPGLRRAAETLPPAPSHLIWFNWGETPARPQMAFSVEDRVTIALFGASADPLDDEEVSAWVTGCLREMEDLATGIQIGGENLANRRARFLSEASLDRLDRLRRSRDPEGLFHRMIVADHA
jgi:FAD/FMN-containing dehydrogenase